MSEPGRRDRVSPYDREPGCFRHTRLPVTFRTVGLRDQHQPGVLTMSQSGSRRLEPATLSRHNGKR